MKLPLPQRRRKRFVIDADIAKAASPSQASEASKCFDFLVALQQCHHKVVFSNELWGEWLNNHSRYSRRWMTEMRGRRLVDRIGDPINRELRNKINKLTVKAKELEAMNKDVHLLEAALATGNIVASKEAEAFDCFVGASGQIGEIRSIVWVNPVKEEDSCQNWLVRGAPPDRERQLGYQHRGH